MPIGSSPFLTADVDDTVSFNAHWSLGGGRSIPGDMASARLDLIRRRVLTGYYASAAMAHEVAQRLVHLDTRTR